MKIRFLSMCLLCIGTLFFFSCNDDDETAVKQTSVSLTFSDPEGLGNVQISGLAVTFTDMNTGKKTSFEDVKNNLLSCVLNEGLYDIYAEGDISYTVGEEVFNKKVRANTYQSVMISGETMPVELDLYLNDPTAGFVIAEIFFTGTTYPNGSQYTGDKYFVIYNNSDEVLYADGLAILESGLNTAMKRNCNPDIMAQAMPVQAVYAIPGNGTTYPVEPGKSLLICDNAIDHTETNPNSFDLRKADFEWYDVSTNPNFVDLNNPEVTDLDKIYCYTATIWGPHNQGLNSYAIGRLGVDKETYLSQYKYSYDYDLVVGENVYPMKGNCYQIPNEWIIDAVNLSIPATFEWTVTDRSLDVGWSYCALVMSDASRYNKSVRRKVLSSTPDGRKILQDTNNSTVDFIPRATPSLMEK